MQSAAANSTQIANRFMIDQLNSNGSQKNLDVFQNVNSNHFVSPVRKPSNFLETNGSIKELNSETKHHIRTHKSIAQLNSISPQKGTDLTANMSLLNRGKAMRMDMSNLSPELRSNGMYINTNNLGSAKQLHARNQSVVNQQR